MKIETQAIHAGFGDDPTTRAVAVPIYQTTSYSFRDTQHGADLFNLAEPGNIYTRIMNPTSDVLEQRMAQLEGGVGALAVASGMAAITAAIQTVARAGDNIVSVSQLYGGTYNFFAHSLPNQGIEARMASGDDIDALEALIDDNTKALFCESIGNPAGNIVDIQALSDMAHKHGVPVIVDNTVATPVLCRPFEQGADIVIHSLTKYIGGHGTSVGGVIIDSGKFAWKDHPRFPAFNQPDGQGRVLGGVTVGNKELMREIYLFARNTGPAMSPFNAWVLSKSLETLAIRVEKHAENALKVAEFLETQENVTLVKYPFLKVTGTMNWQRK